MKTPWLRFLALAAMLGLGVATTANASVVTLTDGNSTVAIDPDSQAGVYSWMVDGNNNLYQQWFWYRVGSTGGQSSIDTISAPTVTPIGSNIVDITYSNSLLSIDVRYSLLGGPAGSFTSDLAEQIRITNLSGRPLDLHFFQYSDFDLNGNPDNDSVSITGGNTATQVKGAGPGLSETVVGPMPSAFEANYYANTLNSLNGGSPYNLNGNASAGPGDVTWAFQWNRVLNASGAGSTLTISKDKLLETTPEPSTMAIAGLGVLGLVGYGIRRRK
jgi:hypothetical protein